MIVKEEIDRWLFRKERETEAAIQTISALQRVKSWLTWTDAAATLEAEMKEQLNRICKDRMPDF